MCSSDLGGTLVIANRNSPGQFVLAGSTAEVQGAAQALAARSVRARVLSVSAAFHSPLVAGAREPFAKALEGVAFADGTIPVYANATGARYAAEPGKARETLAGQIVRPVNFTGQIRAMYEDGVRTFVEIGPGHVLCDLVQSILAGHDVQAVALDA